MSPKSFIVAAALSTGLVLFAGTGASANDKHWNGVGWYLIVDVVDLGLIVLGGPVPDEASCRANLPPDDSEAKYHCEYLSERPDWD